MLTTAAIIMSFNLITTSFVATLLILDRLVLHRHDSPHLPHIQGVATELRTEKIDVDETAQRLIDEASEAETIHIIANRRQTGNARDYQLKEKEQREYTCIVLFLEVDVEDPSEFKDVLEVRGVNVDGYRVVRAESSTIPNAIAAFLLHLRDTTSKETHCYFDWTQGNPLVYLFRYVLSGEGDTAPVTHEILWETERDPERRPVIHVAGK